MDDPIPEPLRTDPPAGSQLIIGDRVNLMLHARYVPSMDRCDVMARLSTGIVTVPLWQQTLVDLPGGHLRAICQTRLQKMLTELEVHIAPF